MPATLRRKPKAKSQAKIYEHTENIYPKGHEESAATKEFVRQELRAELSPIRRDIKWLMLIVSSLAGLILYLHSDTKQEMNRRFTEQKADIDKRFTEQKADIDKRFAEQKADIDKRFDRIESLLQKR